MAKQTRRSPSKSLLLLTMICLPGCQGGCKIDEARPEDPELKAGYFCAAGLLGLPLSRNRSLSTNITSPMLVVGESFGDGNQFGTGCVHVYSRNGSTWQHTAKVFDPNATNSQRFGTSLAVKEDTMVVGADLANSAQGRAFAYALSGNTWTLQSTLQASDSAAQDFFGSTVAVDNGFAFVGAPAQEDSEELSNAGAVYVFKRNGVTWAQSQKLTASDRALEDAFGRAILLSGNQAFISSYDAEGDVGFSGRVHVFNLAGNTWTEAPLAIRTNDPFSVENGFGNALAYNGRLLAVASANDDEEGDSAGAVFIFKLVGGNWVQQQKLTAPDGGEDHQFGTSIAMDESRLVVGAKFANGAVARCGAAYVYQLDDVEHFEYVGKLYAPRADAHTDDWFGGVCLIAGDYVLVGVENGDVDDVEDCGIGFGFTLIPGISPAPRTTGIPRLRVDRLLRP